MENRIKVVLLSMCSRQKLGEIKVELSNRLHPQSVNPIAKRLRLIKLIFGEASLRALLQFMPLGLSETPKFYEMDVFAVAKYLL